MVDFPKIRKVYIKNFRSILELEIDASDFTILVGNNDCGKSNVFRALNLFFNGETNPGEQFDFATDYNKFAPIVAKKAKEILIRVTFDMPDNYQASSGQRLEWTKRWRSDGLQEKQYYIGLDHKKWERKSGSRWVRRPEPPKRTSKSYSLLRLVNFEYVPAIRSPLFLRKLRGRIYEAIAASEESNFRKNSQTFEKSIGKTLSSLTDVLKGKLADDTTLRLPNDLSDLFESLDFLSGDKSISLGNRGDGIKARYIPFLLQFIADKLYEANSRRTFIWAYEEPENNLEFNKSRELANDLLELASEEEIQLFITTHSPIFYNLNHSNSGLCSAYHLSKTDNDKGTVCVVASDLSEHLDANMGVMPIIAPYIQTAQDEVESLLSQQADLQQKLDELNPRNLPTVFVEGLTEYVLLSNLLERFRPRLLEHVFLAQPPVRAGANYVTNMLRSWEFKTKHLPNADRRKAFGILDTDDEGQEALKRLEKDISRPRYAFPKPHLTPAHLGNAFENGMQVPLVLETLWPPEIWQEADDDDWLRSESVAKHISSELSRRLIEDNEALEDIFDNDEIIYLKSSPRDDIKSDWVDWMIEKNDAELEPLSSEFLRLFDKISYELGLTMPGVPLI